jgi:hypothetical protein
MAPIVKSGSSARLSPAEKLARSLARTAGPLSTPHKLNQLLTFTNILQNGPCNASDLSSHSSSTQFVHDIQSMSFNPLDLITPKPVRHYTPKSLLIPLARQPLLTEISYQHSLGSYNAICVDCNALHWKEERSVNRSTRTYFKFSMCCALGRVMLPPLSDPPDAIRELLQNTTSSRNLFT